MRVEYDMYCASQ